MKINIQTKNDGFPVIDINDDLYSIFRELFESEDEAKAELMASHAHICCPFDDIPDMVNAFMVGYLRSVARQARERLL